MKRRISLTIDTDLYYDLDNLPRKISVSEVVNLLLKAFMAELKKGEELTDEELQSIAKSIGDGTLPGRMKERWGSKIDKVETVVESVKKTLGLDKK